MNKQIAVVAHKDYEFPKDGAYIPYFVGPIIQEKEVSKNYLLDNEGDNIAEKNPNYCELTAQYSLWKNSSAEIKGLVHYRRHFMSSYKKSGNSLMDQVLSTEEIEKLLEKADIIVPNQRHYYIETLWSHYEHSHHIEGLELTREVIAKDYPAYLPSFDKVMERRSAHMFNMLIAKKEIFDAYSAWLFDILGKVEAQLDISQYSTYEARVYGFISELLLDVWLDYNQVPYVEQKVKFMEKQNWLKKGGKFLARKVKGGIID